MARDATARLYDVDALKTILDIPKGTVSFQAKDGKLVDLDQWCESMWATRLGDRTGMRLLWMEVTARGELAQTDEGLVLKVPGTDRFFVLADPPGTSPQRSPLAGLRARLQRGETEVTVTGRLDGWQGNFVQFLRERQPHPRRLVLKP